MTDRCRWCGDTFLDDTYGMYRVNHAQCEAAHSKGWREALEAAARHVERPQDVDLVRWYLAQEIRNLKPPEEK